MAARYDLIRGQLLETLRHLRAMAQQDPDCFEYLAGLIAFYRRPDHTCPSVRRRKGGAA
jgi:hypothetical protein